jgi:beta-glucosidase
MKKIYGVALAVFLFLFSIFASAQTTSDPIADRAEAILKKMTLEEKIDYIGGYNGFYVRAMPKLGLPALKMSDGPIGVRNYGPSTAYAAGIALAASWNQDLAGQVGAMIGHEARARGVHFMLGPGVNIYRAPMCSRNFEYFGEDPFLASRMTVAYIKGMQEQGVSATVKHFMGNNSEYDRHNTSSDIDERTMREIYLPAFEAAVKEAHVGAIMNSYNLVNGIHATQNDFINNQVAKKDWGFDGVLMSDWAATYDGVAAANAGLDLEMPSAKFMNQATLLPAIKNGKVTEATIDDKVRRIIRTAIRFGWLDCDQTDSSFPLYNEKGRALALQTAQESMVLLKNEGNELPLDKTKIKTLAVIGPNAYPAIPVGGGSAKVLPFQAISFLEGINHLLGGNTVVTYNRGLAPMTEIYDSTTYSLDAKGTQPGLKAEYFGNAAWTGDPALTRTDPHINFAWDSSNRWPTTGTYPNYSARWSGFYTPSASGAYRISVASFGNNEFRLYVDGKLLVDRQNQKVPFARKEMNLQAGKAYAIKVEYAQIDYRGVMNLGICKADQLVDPMVKKLASAADAVVVCVGYDTGSEAESFDRTFQLPGGQDELINVIREANPHTTVVITSGGGVDMTRWIEKVPAVLQAWYPGQEGGTALAQILFGEFNPSGKLPATFERQWEDSAVHDSYYPDADKDVRYSEGVFLGYRHFDKSNVKPLFPFGYGLSYTTFKYGALAVTPDTVQGDAPVTVSFDLTNTGLREGEETAEVYVGEPNATVPRPIKELKGFAKVDLKPGETKTVSVTLNRRAFSYYDVKTRQWTANPGIFEIKVGSSSQKIELTGQVTRE